MLASGPLYVIRSMLCYSSLVPAVHSRHDGCGHEHWSPTTTQLSLMAPSNR